MSNQKFLNKVKEFAENLDHKYDIDKYKLKESYAQSILVTATIGGSSGGDCWGGRSSDYEQSDSEIVNSLVSSVSYNVMHYFSDYIMVEVDKTVQEHLNDYSRYDYIAQQNDYSDYYGNYSSEGLYDIPVYPLMKKLLDDEHFQILKSYLSNQKNKIEKVFVDRKTSKRIEELNKKLETFEADKTKELSNLKENVERYEGILKSLKEDIKNFSSNKSKGLKLLQDELKSLIKE